MTRISPKYRANVSLSKVDISTFSRPFHRNYVISPLKKRLIFIPGFTSLGFHRYYTVVTIRRVFGGCCISILISDGKICSGKDLLPTNITFIKLTCYRAETLLTYGNFSVNQKKN